MAQAPEAQKQIALLAVSSDANPVGLRVFASAIAGSRSCPYNVGLLLCTRQGLSLRDKWLVLFGSIDLCPSKLVGEAVDTAL